MSGEKHDEDGRMKKPFYKSTFKGANEEMATLCTKSERKQKDQHMIFQKILKQHVTTNFKNPGDILPVIRDLIDPMFELLKDIQKRDSMSSYLSSRDITQPPTPVHVSSSDDPNTSRGVNVETGTPVQVQMEDGMDEAFKESLGFLYKEKMKLFASRRNVLRQNQIKLWGVIWGQCSPTLKTEIKGNDDFSGEMVKYDTVWLLGQLKLASVGA